LHAAGQLDQLARLLGARAGLSSLGTPEYQPPRQRTTLRTMNSGSS